MRWACARRSDSRSSAGQRADGPELESAAETSKRVRFRTSSRSELGAQRHQFHRTGCDTRQTRHAAFTDGSLPCGTRPVEREDGMRFGEVAFGHIEIDGVRFEHDVVIDRSQVRKRKKKASRKFREAFGHTPLSLGENL